MANQTLYKIAFVNRGEIYEMYAKQLFQSDLYGFIEVEEFVFGSRGQVVVDPSEEKLKNEFDSVLRSYIPMQSIIRIDEVDQAGVSKISPAQSSASSNVAQFPGVPPKSRV